VSNIFEEGLYTSMGMFLFMQDKAAEVISDLVDGGRIGADEGRRFIDDFDRRLKRESKEFRKTIDLEVQNILKESQIATKSDLSKIMIKLDKLKDKIADMEEGGIKSDVDDGGESSKVLGG